MLSRHIKNMRLAALFLLIASALLGQQAGTFESHLDMGRRALGQNRYSEAERFFRLAMREGENDPRIVEVLEGLCDLDLLANKYAEAIELQERAVTAIHDEKEIAQHLVRLAGAYRAGGKAASAVPVLLRAIELDSAAYGADDAKVCTDYDFLANTYMELFRYEDARGTWRKSLEARVRRLGPDDLEIAATFVNMGVLEEKDAHPPVALAHYEAALAISEKKVGTESYALTGVLDRMGSLLRGIKNFRVAEPVLQRSLAIREKTLGPKHSDVAPALDNLAMTYFFDGKFAEAEPLFTRSLNIWLATQGEDSPLVAQALDNLGSLQSSQQKYAEAEPFFQRAAGIRERKDMETLSNMALVYAESKKVKLAEECFQRAILIGEKGFGGDHPEVAEVMDQYAAFLRNAGRVTEAKKMDVRAKDVRGHAPKVR